MRRPVKRRVSRPSPFDVVHVEAEPEPPVSARADDYHAVPWLPEPASPLWGWLGVPLSENERGWLLALWPSPSNEMH